VVVVYTPYRIGMKPRKIWCHVTAPLFLESENLTNLNCSSGTEEEVASSEDHHQAGKIRLDGSLADDDVKLAPQ